MKQRGLHHTMVRTIPMTEWGQDHWSLLGYVETCMTARPVADNGGALDHTRMRCNPDHHPLNAHAPGWKTEWSTRLAGHSAATPRREPDHDDYDCLEDLEAAGLLEIATGLADIVFLTETGVAIAQELRQHKGQGGRFATFVPAWLRSDRYLEALS